MSQLYEGLQQLQIYLKGTAEDYIVLVPRSDNLGPGVVVVLTRQNHVQPEEDTEGVSHGDRELTRDES